MKWTGLAFELSFEMV